MTVIACKCGWIGIAETFQEISLMHPGCDPVMIRCFLRQSRMAEDGMSQLISEARWKRTA